MNIAITSKFRPFTYDEMVKPLMQYKEVYDKAAQDYTTLQAQAKMWENEVNRDNNPEAYAMYKRYTDDLNNLVEDFSKGMNMNNRRALLSMKSRYASDIEPIARASKRKEMLSDEQRKMIAQNPTMLYQRIANNMSLDDFINNPNADYGQQYSGALITQQVANAAANIAKEARDSEEGKRKLRKILPYQYEQVQQSGFSREAVMKAIMNSPDADKILTGLVDSAINTSGVLNWGDQNTISRAYDYARQGLYNAIGQTQYQMVTDQYGMQAALNEQQHRHRLAEQKAAQESANIDGITMYDPNKQSLYGKVEKDKKKAAALKEQENLKKQGYLDKDGNFTSAGLIRLRKELSIANLEYQYNNAKNDKERKVYKDKLIKLGVILSNKEPLYSAKGEFIGYKKASKNYRSLYDYARNIGIARNDINNLNAGAKNYITSLDNVNKKQKEYYDGLYSGDPNARIKGLPTIDIYAQNITSTSNKDAIRSVLHNVGDAKIREVTSVDAKGNIITAGNSIKYKDINADHDITRVAFIPSRPGELIIYINGNPYLMGKEDVKTVVGESSWLELKNAARNAVIAKTDAERSIAINNAHIMMGRLGLGTDYKEINRDTSNGTNSYPFNN